VAGARDQNQTALREGLHGASVHKVG
jgi:hypothetical protein